MKLIKGELIKAVKEGKFDVIVHGCNCFCNMGRGVALAIKLNFPLAYTVDRNTIYGDISKLGTITIAHYKDIDIVNAYTQYRYGWGGPHVDYKAIRSCMGLIKQYYSGKRIGMPKIGAGLAGGDWDKIKAIIEEELADEDVTIMYL